MGHIRPLGQDLCSPDLDTEFCNQKFQLLFTQLFGFKLIIFDTTNKINFSILLLLKHSESASSLLVS